MVFYFNLFCGFIFSTAYYFPVCEYRLFGPAPGVFTSPDYPKPYTEHITCTFHLYGPAGTAVYANITDFSIGDTKLDTDVSLSDLLINQTIMMDLNDESKTYVDVSKIE